MQQFIGCDAHKKFSVFVAVNERDQASDAFRVEYERHLYSKSGAAATQLADRY
jgi:hypothetical protein